MLKMYQQHQFRSSLTVVYECMLVFIKVNCHVHATPRVSAAVASPVLSANHFVSENAALSTDIAE